jgi:ABC-2 type transport system permease protein
MTAILIFIVIVIGFNLIPQLTRQKFPKTEKAVIQILTIISITFIILTVLMFNGFKLKGLYSNSIIGIIFILISLMYFALVKISRRKILIVILLIPMILVSLFTLIFGQKIAEYRINDTYRIDVTIGGFLACGENISLTKPAFVIFDKEIFHESSLCLRGIKKIEIVDFNEKRAEFLIYHSGEFDSENPYKYEIENKNVW